MHTHTHAHTACQYSVEYSLLQFQMLLHGSPWGHKSKYLIFRLSCVLPTKGLPGWVGKPASVCAVESWRAIIFVLTSWKCWPRFTSIFPFISDIWGCLLSAFKYFYLKEISGKGTRDAPFCADLCFQFSGVNNMREALEGPVTLFNLFRNCWTVSPKQQPHVPALTAEHEGSGVSTSSPRSFLHSLPPWPSQEVGAVVSSGFDLRCPDS